MTLSAANALQAKTGNVVANTASVVLDAGTQAGSTVVVEISSTGNAITDGAVEGVIPDGFELDAIGLITGFKYNWVFRKRDVAAGEGVAGSTAWDFTYTPVTSLWQWRVTEWDQGLEPVSPLERVSHAEASGTSVTSLSTGTTGTTDRAEAVALAWHFWANQISNAATFSWSGHTNGFTERDQQVVTPGSAKMCSSWSWKFDTAASFETTATVNTTAPHASDVFSALLVVYAATTYA
jgi:hypothetical protein